MLSAQRGIRMLVNQISVIHVLFPLFKSSLPPQAEWVALNYVPFAERSLEVVVDLYHKTACHKAVINEKVLQGIIKVRPRGFTGSERKLVFLRQKCFLKLLRRVSA